MVEFQTALSTIGYLKVFVSNVTINITSPKCRTPGGLFSDAGSLGHIIIIYLFKTKGQNRPLT